MKYFVLFLISFLIAIPSVFAQNETWLQQEGDGYTFQIPPEWEAIPAAQAFNEIHAYQRDRETFNRISVVSYPLDMDGDLNDSFRRGAINGLEEEDARVLDSALITTATGKTVWVRYTQQNEQFNGLVYIIADATHGYGFTLLQTAEITAEDQAMMEQMINSVTFENPRTDTIDSREAFEAGEQYGEMLAYFFWACCCCIILPGIALLALGRFFWLRRNNRPPQPQFY